MDYVNRNEIKRIDNQADKSFSAEFDKLNESLYKINSFLKLSKEIDDMKKENLVKNDIQRKLSLKSQWLNSNHGSTASLNSLPPTDLRKGSLGNVSTQSLSKEDEEDKKRENDLQKKRKKFANFKSVSVQNINASADKPKRRYRKHSNYTSFDELNFIDKIKLSDEEVSQLSQESDFQESEPKSSKNNSGTIFSLKLEPNRKTESKESLSKCSLSSSQRDLSRFFPKKEEKPKPMNVNKNQKELKDVDLSKYFLPSPVQELKSIPSPGQSPKLPRKSLNVKSNDETTASTSNLLRTAIDNLHKMQKPPIAPVENKSATEKQNFSMRNQQLDGDVSFYPMSTRPINWNLVDDDVQLDTEQISENDCEKLFSCLKSPSENIDELFEKVAADVLPELPKQETKREEPIREMPKQEIKRAEIKQEEIKPKPTKKKIVKPKTVKKTTKVNKKIDTSKLNFAGELSESKSSAPPAPNWHKKERFLDDDREAEILSKLSTNLLNEIKLLEKHLELNEKLSEPTGNMTAEELHQTEDDLNNAINDILNAADNESNIGSDISFESAVDKNEDVVDFARNERKVLSYKDEMPVVSTPQKVKCVDLPKANQGVVSTIVPHVLPEVQKPDVIIVEERPSIKERDKTKAKRIETTKPLDEAVVKPETVDQGRKENEIKPKLKDLKTEFFAGMYAQPEQTQNHVEKEKEAPEKAVTVVHEVNNVETDDKLDDVSDAPPVKPVRRQRSRKSSLTLVEIHKPSDERFNSNEKKEDGQNAPRANHRSTVRGILTKEIPSPHQQIKFSELHKTTEPKPSEEIPVMTNIAQILSTNMNTIENSNKNTIENKSAIETKSSRENTQNSLADSVEPTKNIADTVKFNESQNKSYDMEWNNVDSKRTYEPSEMTTSSGSGDYDNVPSTSRKVKLSATKQMSKSFDAPSNDDRDYDNVDEKTIEKPIRRRLSFDKKRNVTDMLIERSKHIHNKKQEFLNDKLVETNPYIKRMIEKERRFSRPTYDRSYISSIPTTSHYDYNPYSYSMNRPMSPTRPISPTATIIRPSAVTTTSIRPSAAYSSNYSVPSTRAMAPPSSSRGVLDMFSRQPSSSSNNKDSCIIS